MKIINEKLNIATKGNPDLINITSDIAVLLERSKLKNGCVVIFVKGSTAAVTSFEFEPGLKQDVEDLFEKLIPSRQHYHHDATWNDANGFSHLRAALQGPSLTIPFAGGRLALGIWQQVVLAEFDNRPRQREVIVQITGE